MGFPRQEYWSGLPFPSPGDLPDPEIESTSPALAGDSLPLSHQGSTFLCIKYLQFSKAGNVMAKVVGASKIQELSQI